ncbi:hypothetical protein AVEN_130965-1 [Araneus ventricosus]|uniref:Uncharacterized protein n=1 Tax=Araneus ventricosus TaxID=182803 RepID=A0A4Y2RPT8_ARAVE|nr:hypothetical protein AVEN_130965-1 [Araneus ventricosus]
MTRPTPPLQASAPCQREDVWPLRMICVQQAPYTADLQWNRVSNLRPSGPKVETLPLGHRGLETEIGNQASMCNSSNIDYGNNRKALILNRIPWPRWPSGKVSALKAGGSRFETRFLSRSTVYCTISTLKLYVGGQTSSRWCGWAGWREGCRHWCRLPHQTMFKITRAIPK